MATINSTFKMQDKATSTLNNISNGIDSVIDRANTLSTSTSNMSKGITNINPALNNAVNSYNNLISKQEQINQKIETMSKQEKILVQQLTKEGATYNQNGKAILNVQKELFNVRVQKDKLIQQSNRLTDEILEQASVVNEVSNNMQNIKQPQQNIENGFSKWQTKLITINQGLQFTKMLAGAIKQSLNYFDEMSLTKARMDLINDGQQTTLELQDKIFAAAQHSRGEYDLMAKSVSKLGLLAGDAFKSNDEIIAFSEMLNKTFKISGASTQEIASATYQLTQAMASGKLQGDEFRAIMENAPMLADAISKYMGIAKGELKDLSSEGVITSDIIKNSLFSASDKINEQFEKMPKTFSSAMNSIANNAQRSLQPLSDKIAVMLNSEQFQGFINTIITLIRVMGEVAIPIFNAIAFVIQFFAQNLWLTIPLLTAIGVVLLGTLVPAMWASVTAILAKAGAWMIANWQLLLVAAMIGLVVGALLTMNPILWTLVGILGALIMAYAIWQVVQWAVNDAMAACPIVWIIVLVIALIAVIFLFMQWVAKATGLASTGMGMIAGSIMVVIGFFKNLGLVAANIGLGIWKAMGACASNIGIAFRNTIKNVQAWFYGLLGTAMNVIAGIVRALNKLPFININTAGIEGKAKEYANKKAQAEGSKEAYKSVSDAFGKGMKTFNAFKKGWASEEFSKGAAWGDKVQGKIQNAIGSFKPGKMLDDLTGKFKQNNGFDKKFGMAPGIGGAGSMVDGNGNMPVDIKKNSDREVKISDEDLKMLKDIANRDYMLNYKQITPNVNIQFGDVRETADVGKIKKELERMMEEELAELYVVEEG